MVNYSDLFNIDKKGKAEQKPNLVPQSSPTQTPKLQRDPEQADRPIGRSADRPAARSPGRPAERSEEQTNNPSTEQKAKRRQARRYAFEIYEDQIERLKRVALQDQLRGGNLSISGIARTALDRYLPELEAELGDSQ